MNQVNENLRKEVENTIGTLAQIYPGAYEDLNVVQSPELSEEELEAIAQEYGIDPSNFQGFGR